MGLVLGQEGGIEMINYGGSGVTVFHGDEDQLPISKQEIANLVSKWMLGAIGREEPVLAQSADRVLAQIEAGLCVLLFVGVELCGFATLYHLGNEEGKDWWEIGSLFVPPCQRGKGLGKRLYQEIYLMKPDGFLVGTSKNPRAVETSLKYGNLKKEGYEKVPKPIRLPLCYIVSCFKPNGFGPHICSLEWPHSRKEGCCVLRMRWPLGRS
jgi:GNAT superfamily N-acetyltransferase